MTITSIALDKLAVSPQNVRKTRSKSSFDELRASILAHGLLNNLVVSRADKGMYYVVAGGRRLVALKELQKEGKLPKDHAVPCHLRDDGDASEASLAENTVREAMHPADEFEAFAALSKDHKPAEIAVRFGVTEKHVNQRLRLGSVAKEIIDAYRADKMNLESVMAFTLAKDHNVQRKVFKAVKDNPHAHSIRRMLTDKKVGSRDKLARFVGLEAYEKAGGKITGDLFKAEQYLDDPALLEELAAAKMKVLEETLKAEGWGWVHVALESEYGFTHKYGRIHAKQVQPPKELVQKHAKLAKECNSLEDQLRDMDDSDPRYDELDAKSDHLVLQLEALDAELENYNKFDPEQMKTAGVYARVDHDGALLIDRGLVSRATEKKLEAAKTGKKAEPEEKGLSQSLLLSLKSFRLQIAQVALASNPDLAYDLLLFGAARSLLSSRYSGGGLDIQFRNKTPFTTETKGTAAAKALTEIKEKLPLKWLAIKHDSDQFEAFRKLKPGEKAAILAYSVSLAFEPALAPARDVSASDITLALSGIDVTAFWRPTAENYLSRITRDQLLDIGSELFGKPWAANSSNMKKGQLVNDLHNAFAKPETTNCDKATIAKINAWLPEGMAFTADGKATKSKKKAA